MENNFLKEQSINYIVKNYPDLRSIINATETELINIPGLTKSKAKIFYEQLQLLRTLESSGKNKQRISSPSDVYDMFKDLNLYQEEHMYSVMLNIKNKIIGYFEIAKGSINSCIVDPRQVFSHAIRINAASVIILHNHPSLDTQPSSDDIAITQRLVECGKLLGIYLTDSIIIGTGYFSFKEEGLL